MEYGKKEQGSTAPATASCTHTVSNVGQVKHASVKIESIPKSK